jgi:RNA polymerase sigma factor (sigma-70 family)
MTVPMGDSELLRQFSAGRSQDAFAAIVARYVDLVYSAARRQLHDPGAAEDATQAVFVLLADKASRLQGTQLSAWLFATTRYICANARRKQARRKNHERKAAEMKPESQPTEEPGWQAIAPLLDEAIDSLPAGEKDLVLLRFFEKRSFKEVGQRLSISEDAARKRIDRATCKLREFFARAGVTTSPAWSLETVLLAHAVTTAPAMLAKLVATKAGASAVAAGASGLSSGVSGGLSQWGTIMATATGKKVAIVAISALLLAGGTAAVVVPAITRSKSATPGQQGRIVKAPMPAMSMTTKNGVVVELLGVSDFTKSAPWWEPNGSPLPRAPYSTRDWMRDSPEKGFDPEQRFQFAFRARFASPDPTQEDIFLDPAFTPGTRRQMWQTPNPRDPESAGLMCVGVAWDRPVPTQARVAVGVAAGPWTVAARSDTPSVETVHVLEDKPDEKITFKAIAEVSGEAQFTMGYSPQLYTYNVDRPQTRIVAVVGGKDIPSRQLSSGGVPGVTFGELVAFNAPAATITAIRLDTRKYEPVVFENVSLRSGTMTEPKVTLLPLGDPLVTPKPAAATKPLRPKPQ